MIDDGTAPAPALRVVRGDPDDAELAALVVALALAARRAAAGPARTCDGEARRPGRWADPARRLGVPAPGPGAWAASALPR